MQLRINRIAGDETDRANLVVLQSELVRHQVNLRGLEDEQRKLIVRVSHAGVVRDVDRDLQAREWIDQATPIARVVGGGTAQVKCYVSEDDIWRIDAGAIATFIPEDPMMSKRHGRVVEVVQTGIGGIDLPYLATIYGGAVPSDRNAENEIKPRSGRHLVRVELDGPTVARAGRGTVHITSKRESIAASIWRRVLQVLVREGSA